MSLLRSPSRHWRVFYARPNSERRAAGRLEACGLTTLVPVRRVEKMWSDRRKWIAEPLFRGYLFAHVDERERLRVLEDEAVVRCLRFNGKFAELSEGEVGLLRALAAVPERLEVTVLSSFPLGQDVQIAEGPLAGVRGRVIQHRRAPLLVIELHSIRQAVRVQLRADWLQPYALVA